MTSLFAKRKPEDLYYIVKSRSIPTSIPGQYAGSTPQQATPAFWYEATPQEWFFHEEKLRSSSPESKDLHRVDHPTLKDGGEPRKVPVRWIKPGTAFNEETTPYLMFMVNPKSRNFQMALKGKLENASLVRVTNDRKATHRAAQANLKRVLNKFSNLGEEYERLQQRTNEMRRSRGEPTSDEMPERQRNLLRMMEKLNMAAKRNDTLRKYESLYPYSLGSAEDLDMRETYCREYGKGGQNRDTFEKNFSSNSPKEATAFEFPSKLEKEANRWGEGHTFLFVPEDENQAFCVPADSEHLKSGTWAEAYLMLQALNDSYAESEESRDGEWPEGSDGKKKTVSEVWHDSADCALIEHADDCRDPNERKGVMGGTFRPSEKCVPDNDTGLGGCKPKWMVSSASSSDGSITEEELSKRGERQRKWYEAFKKDSRRMAPRESSAKDTMTPKLRRAAALPGGGKEASDDGMADWFKRVDAIERKIRSDRR